MDVKGDKVSKRLREDTTSMLLRKCYGVREGKLSGSESGSREDKFQRRKELPYINSNALRKDGAQVMT